MQMLVQGSVKKASVFLCTNEELLTALRKKSKYKGLAEAIISGKEETPALEFDQNQSSE